MSRNRQNTRDVYRGIGDEDDPKPRAWRELVEEFQQGEGAAQPGQTSSDTAQAAKPTFTVPKRNVVRAEVDPRTIVGGAIGRQVLRYPFRPIQNKLGKLAAKLDIACGAIDDTRTITYVPPRLLTFGGGRAAYERGYGLGRLNGLYDQGLLDRAWSDAPQTFETGESGLPLKVAMGDKEVWIVSADLTDVAWPLANEYYATRAGFSIPSEHDFAATIPIAGLWNTDYVTAGKLTAELEGTFVNREIPTGPLTVLPPGY